MGNYYLAGPMTGYPQFNFPAFYKAAEDLRKMGYEICNPAELDADDGTAALAAASPTGALDENGKINNNTWGDLLARDVKLIADECDGIVLLPNWADSKGVIQEVTTAMNCGYPVFEFVDGELRQFRYSYITQKVKEHLDAKDPLQVAA